jgi:hypothetical protein
MINRATTMTMCRLILASARVLIVALSVMSLSVSAGVNIAGNEAAKSLPDQIGSFRASGPVEVGSNLEFLAPGELGPISIASRNYQDTQGASFNIQLVRTETDPAAYALLTRVAAGKEEIQKGIVGSVTLIGSGEIAFCKGSYFAQIAGANKEPTPTDRVVPFARSFAETLPTPEDDIPVLVQHLPNWQAVANRSAYAVTLSGLTKVVPNQPVLDVISFDGGTEAVEATYGQAQLVIVEFTTPQFSVDNDLRLTTKIQELKSQGQPMPSGYRRVGNYSVFVFNAPDEKSANELIDQVQYQKVVQWLGDDPHMAERLQRYFQHTTAGVLIAVLKSSGLSLILCLGVGVLFGALLFRHRRAQQATLYSDAGGAVRLNLDELTDPGNSRRLLKPGKQPESGSSQS